MEVPIVLKAEEWIDSKRVAPYFLDEVWREAEKILSAKGRSPAEGGWTIRTTLDPTSSKNGGRSYRKNGCLKVGFKLALSPLNLIAARLLLLLVDVDYNESPFNRATQAKRQPGSAMKPILYAAALENGFNPLTFLFPQKTIFTYGEKPETYEPKNVNGKFATHPISLAQALAISDNIFATMTLEEVGYKNYQGYGQSAWDRRGITFNTCDRTWYGRSNSH